MSDSELEGDIELDPIDLPTDLPALTPVEVPSTVHPDDMAEVMGRLVVGEGYLFRDLYATYAHVAQVAGRRPCPSITFGRELRRLGHTPGRLGPSRHRIWFIN